MHVGYKWNQQPSKNCSVFFLPYYLRFNKLCRVKVVYPNYLRFDKYCKEQSCLNKIMYMFVFPADGTWVIVGWGVLINPNQRLVLSIISPLDMLSSWSMAALWEISMLCEFYDSDPLGQLQSYLKERSWSVFQRVIGACSALGQIPPGNHSRRLEQVSQVRGEMCPQHGMLQISPLNHAKSLL